MMKHLICSIMILVGALLVGSCYLGRQKESARNAYIFSEMWKVDSCGLLGYRKVINDYLFSTKERMDRFNGKSQPEILSLFPYPNEVKIDSVGQIIYMTYIVEGYYGVCELPNEGVLQSMYFIINSRTKKVISSGWSIY